MLLTRLAARRHGATAVLRALSREDIQLFPALRAVAPEVEERRIARVLDTLRPPLLNELEKVFIC